MVRIKDTINPIQYIPVDFFCVELTSELISNYYLYRSFLRPHKAINLNAFLKRPDQINKNFFPQFSIFKATNSR